MPEATEVPTVPPPSDVVFRLGYYAPHPFSPVPWRVVRQRTGALIPANDDQTIGGRFDDPAGRDGLAEARRFRTIYCASQRAAAFGESTEPFRSHVARPDEGVKGRTPALEAIIGRNSTLQEAVGVITADWLRRHRIGTAQLDRSLRFVDLTNPDILQYLEAHLRELAANLGFRRLDYGALLGPNRILTQAVAGHCFEQLDPVTDEPLFDGLYYRSSLNLNWECWAVFDLRFRPEPQTADEIDAQDADLVDAARRYGLAIETPDGGRVDA